MKKELQSLKYFLDCYNIARPIVWREVFGNSNPIDLEIGFGRGDYLIRLAKENPRRNFIGVEKEWESIYKILGLLTKENCKRSFNIRVIKVDATVALERLFDQRTIERVYCLFPCPWPKKGHIKHRLFSRKFFKLINNRLKELGEITIVTDFYPFFDWIKKQSHNSGFKLKTKKIKPQFNTKYERKWKEAGQEKFFELCFKKVKHINSRTMKDVILQSYKVNKFNYKNFKFVDQTGQESIIFKDMLFDEKKLSALIYFVVAEEGLTQHFRVAVIKQKNVWNICRAEGQNIFPTEGLQKALELTYKTIIKQKR